MPSCYNCGSPYHYSGRCTKPKQSRNKDVCCNHKCCIEHHHNVIAQVRDGSFNMQPVILCQKRSNFPLSG